MAVAQCVHRVDMRLRLGLLQDPAAIERQIAREAAEAAKKSRQEKIPTAKTEAQSKADEVTKEKEREKIAEKIKHHSKPRIRPLSEAKAIDSGANFISETFLFTVALSLILFETWRRDRKENNRRNDVAEKLAELEARDQEKNGQLLDLQRELAELRAKSTSGGSSWFRKSGPESVANSTSTKPS